VEGPSLTVGARKSTAGDHTRQSRTGLHLARQGCSSRSSLGDRCRWPRGRMSNRGIRMASEAEMRCKRRAGQRKGPQRNRGRTPVLLAVGEPLAAAALKRVVESDGSFEVVAVASDAQCAIGLGGQGCAKIAVPGDLAPPRRCRHCACMRKPWGPFSRRRPGRDRPSGLSSPGLGSPSGGEEGGELPLSPLLGREIRLQSPHLSNRRQAQLAPQ
jgi:hypothetical protein